MTQSLLMDESLKTVLQMNEKALALTAKNSSAAASIFAEVEKNPIQAGQRIVELRCNPRQIIGIAMGMGVYGLYPITCVDQEDLYSGAFLQLLNSVSQLRYRSGGQYVAPMAIVVRYSRHLDIEPLLLQIPGFHVYAPSSAADYTNILEEVSFEQDPSIILVPAKWPEISDELKATWEKRIPLQSAKVLRVGTQITLASYGTLVHTALAAAQLLQAEGRDVEVIDLRSLAPFDRETLLNSVRKTGRLVILQDSAKSFGVGAEIAAYVGENAVEALLAPIRRVAAFDVPDAGNLQSVAHPSLELVVYILRNLVDF